MLLLKNVFLQKQSQVNPVTTLSMNLQENNWTIWLVGLGNKQNHIHMLGNYLEMRLGWSWSQQKNPAFIFLTLSQ